VTDPAGAEPGPAEPAHMGPAHIEPAHDEPAGAEPATRARRSWPRRLVGPVLGLAVVVVTFAFVLPKVADYASVWDAIKTMSIAQLALLLVVAAWNLARTAGHTPVP